MALFVYSETDCQEAMTMTTGEAQDRVLQAAMDWLLRVQEAPGDPLLRRQVEAWRAADPEHAAAWARAEQAWGLVAEVPPTRVADWPAARRPARRAHGWRLGLAGLALAACLMLLFVPVLMNDWADHATAVAETRSITLQDGSRVSLGPRSAIDTDFAAGDRKVTLLAGEAFFEVTPDSRRPFVVMAGGVAVTVVGTAFDVRLSRASVSVAVQHGFVDVRSGPNSSASGLRIGTGEKVKVDRATRRLEQGTIDPLEVASWREGRMFVNGATVGEVVEDLQRYRSGWIVVPDQRLASQRITGLFDLDDSDRALTALVEPFNGRVQSVTPLLQILLSP